MTGESLGQEWFDVATVADGVWAIKEPFQVEEVFSFLIAGSESAVLVDTGTGAGDIRKLVDELTSLPVRVINSHAHWDHIGGNWRFSAIAIHHLEADRLPLGVPHSQLIDDFGPRALTGPLPEGFDRDTFEIPPSVATTLLHGGERVDLGGRTLEIIHCPGHSPGGIVLLDAANGLLFSTDVAYPAPLYAFGSDSNWQLYKTSMRKLASLVPDLTSVHGSHTHHTMSPAMLVAMYEAFTAIENGRAPDRQRMGQDEHLFDGFSVLRPSTLDEERGDA